MDALNWVVLQFFQPYFYYSIVLSVALFIAVNLAVRFTRVRDHRLRSYLFALPMLAPLFIYALYPPQLNIQVMEGRGVQPFSFPADPMTFMPVHPVPPAMDVLLSVSGSLCMTGIVLGLSLLVVCLILNRFGTKRGFVPISEEDYPKVLGIVAKRCKRFGIKQPSIGLVEDLRPNAFVGGHGRLAVLVFSLGMLETFDEEELTVAIDHELMHLKNRDTLFRSASIGLIALSFFNPIAYFSYTAALREREHLADDGSTSSKRSREALKSALRKAAEMTSQVEQRVSVSSIRFMGMVPLFPRNMLATHPAEERRLESIGRSDRERRASAKTVCLALLYVVLLTVFVDTRNILVQGSAIEMIGSNGPLMVDRSFMGGAGPIPVDGLSQNITFLPLPWMQNQTASSYAHLLNISQQLVATSVPSN